MDLDPVPDPDSQKVWIQIRNTAFDFEGEKWPDSGSSEFQRCEYRVSYRTPDPCLTYLSLDNANGTYLNKITYCKP